MLIERVLMVTTISLLVWLPLPLGSNRTWAVNVAEFLILANAALCVMAWSLGFIRYRGSRGALITGMLWWSAWLIWVAAHTFPLPTEVIAQWAEHRFQLEQSLSGIGSGPATEIAISIDRDVSVLHWHESLAYACLFLSALLLAGGSRGRMKLFAWALLISGVIQAAFGSAMVLGGIEYNALGPKTAYLGSATGSFVNRNHFAGYLELTASVAVGLMLMYSANRSQARNFWHRFLDGLRRTGSSLLFVRLSLIVMVIGLILSQSRMGNAAALGGLLLAGMLYVLLKRRADWKPAVLMLITLLVVDLWLVGDWFGIEELAERFEQTDLESDQRALLLPVLVEMANVYAPFGSGLGTFEMAYPEFQSVEVRGRPRHAHNDYAQFFIETGWPGILLLAVFVLATIGRAMMILRNRRDPIYCGMAVMGLMAMICIALHSVTDFNLQIPANAATLVFIMALVWSSKVYSSRSSKKQVKAGKTAHNAEVGS